MAFQRKKVQTQSLALGEGFGSHLVQLAAGRSDLLDAELAELSLELAELLRQLILVLAPERNRLDLARRL